MSLILNECDCCGFGFEKFDPQPVDLVVVGHRLITTALNGDCNLSALDLFGNILWQIQMDDDSFGNPKRPLHIRFDSNGFFYVAWQSSSLTTRPGFLTDEARFISNEDTVGGVDKYDSNGTLLWTCELLAQKASGGSQMGLSANCVDVSPVDGTIWTSTLLDVNDDCIHQIDPDGSVIQSFGWTEFMAYANSALVPFAAIKNGDSGSAGCTFLRVTEDGNIWFAYGGDANAEPLGPFKCDSSGNILEVYKDTFGTASDSVDRMGIIMGLLLFGDDDIVICGSDRSLFGTSTPDAIDNHLERWTPSTNTKQWQIGGGDFTIEAGTWASGHGFNQSSFRAMSIDGDLSKIVYSVSQAFRRSTGHAYTVFGVTAAGAQNTMSSEQDNTSPFTDPRDHIRIRGQVACLPDYVFVSGHRLPANATAGLSSSQVVSLDPTTGRKVWINDLGNTHATTGFTYCIAAFKT